MRLQRPPVKGFFSSTVTLYPACARRAAVEVPPTPAPITMAVGGRGLVSGIAGCEGRCSGEGAWWTIGVEDSGFWGNR